MSRSLIPMIGTLLGADAIGAANSGANPLQRLRCDRCRVACRILAVAATLRCDRCRVACRILAPVYATLYYRPSHCSLHTRWSLHVVARVAWLSVVLKTVLLRLHVSAASPVFARALHAGCAIHPTKRCMPGVRCIQPNVACQVGVGQARVCCCMTGLVLQRKLRQDEVSASLTRRDASRFWPGTSRSHPDASRCVCCTNPPPSIRGSDSSPHRITRTLLRTVNTLMIRIVCARTDNIGDHYFSQDPTHLRRTRISTAPRENGLVAVHVPAVPTRPCAQQARRRAT